MGIRHQTHVGDWCGQMDSRHRGQEDEGRLNKVVWGNSSVSTWNKNLGHHERWIQACEKDEKYEWHRLHPKPSGRTQMRHGGMDPNEEKTGKVN